MNQPLISFIVPAFNGEPFIRHCFHSLVNDRIIQEGIWNDYEIILINDGSKDKTSFLANKIADEWNYRFDKQFIRVIDKPNGQYGSVINRGLKEAKGVYFKVLDVDDTFHVESLIQLVFTIKGLTNQPDVVFTDHTFEKVGTNNQELQTLREHFHPYVMMNVKTTPFPNDLITMHSIIYKKSLLIEMEYEQIEGVFYSDSEYSVLPLTKAMTMYYLNIPLYRYYIGRDEQSINMKVMIKNQEHQWAVVQRVIEKFDFDTIKSKHVKKYSLLVVRRLIQWRMLIIISDKNVSNNRNAVNEVFSRVKELEPKYYEQLMSGAFFIFARLTRGYGIGWFVRIGVRVYSKFKKNILAEWD